MTWTALSELMAQRWGDFASLLGLIVSVLWDIVGLRAQEIIAATSLVLTRWSEKLSLSSRSNLLRCQGLSSSISDVALVASSSAPTAQQVARIAQAHGQVTQLLNAELGEALRSAEGSG